MRYIFVCLIGTLVSYVVTYSVLLGIARFRLDGLTIWIFALAWFLIVVWWKKYQRGRERHRIKRIAAAARRKEELDKRKQKLVEAKRIARNQRIQANKQAEVNTHEVNMDKDAEHTPADDAPTDKEIPSDPNTRRHLDWLLRKQHGICGICYEPLPYPPTGDVVHVDHIIPRSLGGSDSRENLQATHANCNLAKGDGRRQLREEVPQADLFDRMQ